MAANPYIASDPDNAATQRWLARQNSEVNAAPILAQIALWHARSLASQRKVSTMTIIEELYDLEIAVFGLEHLTTTTKRRAPRAKTIKESLH